MGTAIIENHILSGTAPITEPIAEIETERYTVQPCTAGSPTPDIVISPHTASPVKDSHIFSPIKNIIAPVKVHFALDRHTIHLLIVIKSLLILLPRCCNTDAVHLRLLHQKIRRQCLTILKITENTLNSSSMRLHRITKMNPTISEIRIAIVRCPPQSQSSHRHCRQYGLSMFLSFHKINQRNTN